MAALVPCLEHVGDGLVVLDPCLRVVHMTDSARRLLQASKGQIAVQHGHFILAAPSPARHLRQFVESLRPTGSRPRGAETFFIERPPSEPLIASVFALLPADDAVATRLLLVLRDLGDPREPNWQCLAERYRLSHAELRLCIALTKGSSLAECSEEFHISVHTARSQLKSIFNKTGTRRQVRLLRLILAFVDP